MQKRKRRACNETALTGKMEVAIDNGPRLFNSIVKQRKY